MIFLENESYVNTLTWDGTTVGSGLGMEGFITYFEIKRKLELYITVPHLFAAKSEKVEKLC